MDWRTDLCHGNTVPTLLFGPIHRLVSSKEKLIQGITMVGKYRDTNTDGQSNFVAVLQFHGLVTDTLAQALGCFLSCISFHFRQDDDKLFASEAAQGINTAYAFLKQFTDRTEYSVTSRVPPGIIDFLEVIKINPQQCEGPGRSVVLAPAPLSAPESTPSG